MSPKLTLDIKVVIKLWNARTVFVIWVIPLFRFIFLEFSNANDAAQAVKTANGYKLDKHHIFAVNHFEDFDK